MARASSFPALEVIICLLLESDFLKVAGIDTVAEGHSVLFEVESGYLVGLDDLVKLPRAYDVVCRLTLTSAGFSLRTIPETFTAHVELILANVDEILVVLGVVINLKKHIIQR